ALRIVTALAHPVIPEATAKIWTQLGLGGSKKYPLQDLRWGQLHLGTKLGRIEPVFPRADEDAVGRWQKMDDEGRTAAATPEPETLIGRKVVIVVNLAQRKLRGLESNGMIVAASPEGGKPVLCSFLEDVPVGTRLK